LSYSDLNNDGDIDVTGNPLTNEILKENNYYPFGLRHEGYNTNIGSTNLAEKKQFAGEEFEDELDKNTVAFHWRDYAPAIGRFNKIDRFAEKYQNLTPYHYAANNPLRYTDVKGDSLQGITRSDARKARRAIRKNFRGKNRKLRKLFRTNGKKFKSISKEALANASDGVSEEAAILASAYAEAINSDEVHRVEFVNRKDKLSKFSQEKTALGLMKYATGADVDKKAGGAINAPDMYGGTHTIIVNNAKNKLPLFDTQTNKVVGSSLNIPATLSHELLGHGLGLIHNSEGSMDIDAIQMENLSLRLQGLGRYQRFSHADRTKTSVLTFGQLRYSGIPTHFNQ
jgi:RHS repeat-associated protein